MSLAARTAQSYFELVEANLQAQVAEQSIKDRRTIAELVRGRFTRGLTRGLDVRLALTDLANAEAQLAQSRNQVQIVTRQLDVLLGRYPGGRKEAHITSQKVLPKPPAALSAGLPSQLLERRPDLTAAFSRLKAMDSRVESAKKALLPRITLTANGGASSTAMSDSADPRSAAWNLAAGLVQPIFTGGRLKGEIRLNEALTKEALNHYRSTALNPKNRSWNVRKPFVQSLSKHERLSHVHPLGNGVRNSLKGSKNYRSRNCERAVQSTNSQI